MLFSKGFRLSISNLSCILDRLLTRIPASVGAEVHPLLRMELLALRTFQAHDSLVGRTTTPHPWHNHLFAVHQYRFLLKGRKAPVPSLLISKGLDSLYFFFPFSFYSFLNGFGVYRANETPLKSCHEAFKLGYAIPE